MEELRKDELEHRKCSRCRRWRNNEQQEEMKQYSTCGVCRQKRKVQRMIPTTNRQSMDKLSSSVYFIYDEYLKRLETNVSDDLVNVRFIGTVDSKLVPLYTLSEINSVYNPQDLYSDITSSLITNYIQPISLVTDYVFRIRDHHRGGVNTKKVTLTFICAQDRTRQRPSRSKNIKSFSNSLKIHDCHSKLNLKYDLLTGRLDLCYSHRYHASVLTYQNKASISSQLTQNSTQYIAAQMISRQNENIDEALKIQNSTSL